MARVIRETLADRAPGPDGFPGAFFRAAWDIVGPDIIRVLPLPEAASLARHSAKADIYSAKSFGAR